MGEMDMEEGRVKVGSVSCGEVVVAVLRVGRVGVGYCGEVCTRRANGSKGLLCWLSCVAVDDMAVR